MSKKLAFQSKKEVGARVGEWSFVHIVPGWAEGIGYPMGQVDVCFKHPHHCIIALIYKNLHVSIYLV